MPQRLLVILPAHGHGGCEYSALSFARHARDAIGLDVIVAIPAVAEARLLVELATGVGLPVLPLALRFDADDDQARVAAQRAALRDLLRTTPADAVFLPLPWPTRGLGLVAGLAEAGVPALVKFALVPDDLYAPDRSILDAARRAHPRRQTWFANAPASAALVERHFGLDAGRVECFEAGPIGLAHLLPPTETGLDLDRTTARASVDAEFGLPPGCLLAVTVGRLAEQKGHAVLVEAIARLDADAARLRFLWAGDGEARPALEAALGRSGLADRVVFTGFRADVRRLLRAADLFVLPSLYEGGSSQALLEAMEEGLPCVASGLPGVADVASDGTHALLVPPADAEALAAALSRLARDEGLRRRIAEAARDRARHHGAEAMFAATVARLLPLMADRAPANVNSKYEKFTRLVSSIRRRIAKLR